VLAVVCGTLGASSQEILDTPPATDLRQLCPPERRIEFQLGTTSLYVDPGWLSPATLMRLAQLGRGACPEGPLQGVALTFERPRDPDARGTFAGRGLPWRISISAAGPPPRQPAANIPSAPATRRVLPGGASAEDITDHAPFLAIDDSQRFYRMQHSAASHADWAEPFVVSCNTIGRVRLCTARTVMGTDLRVEYEFRQDRGEGSDIRRPTPDGAVREPEGFLELDARVRAWIEALKQPARGGPDSQ
jgi:hypothetical protein